MTLTTLHPRHAGHWVVRLRVAFILLALACAFFVPHASHAQPLRQITGVWRGVEVTPLGPSDVEVIFFPNGTYSRAHVLGDMMTRDTGRYEIVENWIHFYLQNWSPTEYRGQPLSWPTSDTWVVTRYDGGVLETANIHVERAQ